MPNPEQNKARKLFSGKLFRLFRKKKRKKEKSKLESQECCVPTKDSLVVECNEHLENVPCVSCDDSYNSSCSKAIDKEKTITADSKKTEHLYCEKIKENEKNRLREELIKDNPISEENKNIVINVANDEDQSCKYFAAPVLENIENFENKLESRSLDRTEQSIIQNEVMELESANNDRSIDLKQVASTNKKEVDNIVSIAKEKTSSNVNNKCKELGKSSKIPKYIQELDIERIKDHRKTNKFLRKESETKIDENSSEDSDSFEDENKQLIVHEVNERNISDEYFTKGKYISYFLLEIERQSYDPTEVYSMIRYYDSDESNVSDSEGENSSSESMSPNIPTTLRRKLLHRLSADNLIVNSPTNSMRHSSPESIKSAPIQLKPRSTSHDALTRKKDRQATQIDSTDSLAKQALLAAQVLNLIPTQKARERNFLHGRIAANSLLGPVELEKVLPNREIKIFVGTWNMNGQTPPKELNDFMLPSEIETVPDMLAIGTQESCSERSEWEAALQETLGPSHVLLTSTALGTLHLALFLRRDLIWFCSVPEDSNFSTRPGTAFRTKGAVALALMLFGTSFLFVTAHLTAHQDKVKERVNDIKKIVRNLDLPKDLPTRHKDKDVTQNFDCVFWCGDLNFRLAQPREEVIQWVTDTQFPQEMPINLHKDQLRAILNEGAVLRGFKEAPITFPPTYKYDPGTQNFDSSSKQRTPAYTDRILFKGKGHTKGHIRRVNCEGPTSHKDGTLECLTYDSVPSICTSDHKPVWGVFKAILRPGIDTIPLAAGLFNRDVYLEGIKRRAAAMDETQGTSRICSIQ